MIHYHGAPITPASAAKTLFTRRHAMVSHAYPEQLPLVAEVCQSFALDNGAFTRWKQGRQTDWSGYVEWVQVWAQHPGFDWCLIPDVIDGDESANDNLLAWWRTLELAVPSVPVWHYHESLERLARLVANYRHVALGSSGEYATIGTLKWWGRTSEVMEVACDPEGRPRAALHGLRMLDPTIFSHLPLKGADSANIGQNVGIDKKWSGPYEPMTKETRALVMADRIEFHASASRWIGTGGIQKNLELVG